MPEFHFHFAEPTASSGSRHHRSRSRTRTRHRSKHSRHSRSKSQHKSQHQQQRSKQQLTLQDAITQHSRSTKRTTRSNKRQTRSKSAKADHHRHTKSKKLQSHSSHTADEESNSSNEGIPALRAPTRAPNVEVGWRIPLGQLEQAPIQPIQTHTTPPPTTGPPTEFIGPQSAFRSTPPAAKPSIKPTTTTAGHNTNKTTPTAAPSTHTPIPTQAPEPPTSEPQGDSNTAQHTTPQTTDTHTHTSSQAPVPPGPPPTIGQSTPQYQPRTRHDPYSQIFTQVKAAPPLPEKMAWKMAPGKWGDPLQIVQSMVEATTELVNRADQVIDRRQANSSTANLNPPADSTHLSAPTAPNTATQHDQHNTLPANIPPQDTSTPTSQQTAYQILRSKLQRSKSNQAAPNTAVSKAPAIPIQLPTQPIQMPPPPTRPKVELYARTDRPTVTLIPNKQSATLTQRAPKPTASTPTTTPPTSHNPPQTDQQQVTPPQEASASTSTSPFLPTSQPQAQPSQVFQALQTKATQHTQQPDDNITQAIGPEVQQWQMVEQVPSNQQDKEEYERNKHEFKSWKGVLRYPAPPQQLWDRIQMELTQICEEENVPNLPQYEHKYISALLAALGPTVKEQIERVQFYVSEDQAVWILRLRRSQPPILSAAWTFSYQFYHGTETGSLWNILREGVIRPTLADQGSVGFYGRCTQENTPWSTLNTIRRVIDSGKWSTPAIIGGVVETTCQHHTMNSGSGEQAQTACRTKGLVHMKRDKKWVIRSDLAQITCLAIPVLRESNLTDLDARGLRMSNQSMISR